MASFKEQCDTIALNLHSKLPSGLMDIRKNKAYGEWDSACVNYADTLSKLSKRFNRHRFFLICLTGKDTSNWNED